MSNVSWDVSAEDFGQKVDLCVRIREILRNYPEGTSILKELLQNADDAGARTVRFCTVEQREIECASDPLSILMKGPSLLAYNSAKFTETDFKSIQQIGDSLKKDKNGTKTGRFGVGVNSTYHLTDVPMFVSGNKVVMFDPQATFVPGINPVNPGKMIDCSKPNGRSLVQGLPVVFDPLKVFGCDLSGKDFDGTIFRFALRTEEQAVVSRLSHQSHELSEMRNLMKNFESIASNMLLFLKNVECIEIYDWISSDEQPVLVSKTHIVNVSDKLRKKRSYMLNAPSRVPQEPITVDYVIDVESTHFETLGNTEPTRFLEKWLVCNQLGGGNASKMAKDPSLSHMKLVPWAGVAARVLPRCEVDDGNAYCFLPLPVKTNLPVHVNGYFELSSNRRDVWWGDDMSGDGKSRAEWNKSIIADLASPSYCRLVMTAIQNNFVNNETYEALLPQKRSSGPFKLLCESFFVLIRDSPVLFSACCNGSHWIPPSKALLLHDDDDKVLADILSMDKLPLVLLKSKDLKSNLIILKTCERTTTPALMRRYFSQRQNITNGALESDLKLKFAYHLLNFCTSDINPPQYRELEGCQFVPLANGDLGRFCSLPTYDSSSLVLLKSMGFSNFMSLHALRLSSNDIDAAMDWLLTNKHSDTGAKVEYGVDPFLVCETDCASLLRNATDTFVDLNQIEDPILKNFFTSIDVSTHLNTLVVQPDMIADILERALPISWRGKDVVPWNEQDIFPTIDWFADLWKFICSSCDPEQALQSISEKFCVVPTSQGVVCPFSPGSAVLYSCGLPKDIQDSLIHLGVRLLDENVLPQKNTIPEKLWSYIFRPTRDGIIKALDAALRRDDTKEGVSTPMERLPDELKDTLFRYLSSQNSCPMSVHCTEILRRLPLFRSYAKNTNTVDAPSFKYVPMTSSPIWYVLDEASDEDCSFMTSDFLCASTRLEVKFLQQLGATQISRPGFYMKVVLPQFTANHVTTAMQKSVSRSILTNLQSLCMNDASFSDFLSKAKFIHSAETNELKAPLELYDPQSTQLLVLMDPDFFPNECYVVQDLLLALRKLGLQSTLNWDVVLECCRSIEREGTSDVKDAALSAMARGRELLQFLDMHMDEYFPEFMNEKKSRTSRFFKKMNDALFEDSEKKKRDKETHARRINELLNIKWIPVLTDPPHQHIPWPQKRLPVASPLESVNIDKMWLVSYNRPLADVDIRSYHLKNLFGWMNDVSIKDVAVQLQMLSRTFYAVKSNLENTYSAEDLLQSESDQISALCQKYSSEVGRIYHILNNVDSDHDKTVLHSTLHGSAWIWMGDDFVSSDHVAFTSSFNAHPYLYTVPPDILCFKNLLSIFNVRDTFGTSDYCLVLRRMAETKASKLDSQQIELAINLVQKISDDALRLENMEVYAPTDDGHMELASNLIYDDAPWLSKDLPAKNDFSFIHSKLSANVCDKIGVKSVRKLLIQSNSDMISFGDGIVHEAFGQSESLTRRLKNIVEMYPEGPQQLNELIQNADDANATVVKFVISFKQHGKSSLLGQKMSDWQGGALYCYNDATFSAQDFENLSKIGQASKIEKLTTTGRFGLGFNSVFHWTDVPSIVSGEYLVIFDPHAKYVPGATSNSRGIKIKFAGTDICRQFPHQMLPYCLFGNDMKKSFDGTLFRFPFRNDTTASESEISKKNYGHKQPLDELMANFKKSITKTLLFLRSVQRVELYLEADDESGPKLQYYADVINREVLPHSFIDLEPSRYGLDTIRNIASTALFGSNQTLSDWSAISNFIAGSDRLSRDAFYGKLLRTPESQLPKTQHVVTLSFVDRSLDEEILCTDKYLLCSALGGGKCRAMACNPEHRDMKFLPWGSIAAHLTRNGCRPPKFRGGAFCFLPLPAETGFSVHINGYFELSSNRRDIWFGDDMTGAGQIRSEWNTHLLRDVISPLYANMLLFARSFIGPKSQFYELWPTDVSSDLWKVVRSRVFQLAEDLPLVYSSIEGGQWVNSKQGVFLEEECVEVGSDLSSIVVFKKRLQSILLEEKLMVVSIPGTIIRCFKNELCDIKEINAAFIRNWYKRSQNHPSLEDRENAIFLLRYCIDDLYEDRQFHNLVKLPLLPLLNGRLGVICGKDSGERFFVVRSDERYLLRNGASNIVDTWTSDTRLNTYLSDEDIFMDTNIVRLNPSSFIWLLGKAYPPEWQGVPEVHWSKQLQNGDGTPLSIQWLAKVWDYISTENGVLKQNADLLFGTLQIVPSCIGENDKTIQVLSSDLPVLNTINLKSGTKLDEMVARLLRSVGIRILDNSIFIGRDTVALQHILGKYTQPPNANGALRALMNSISDQVSGDDILKSISARFKHLSGTDRKKIFEFLRDTFEESLTVEENSMLKALPIFEVFSINGESTFCNLSDHLILPPSCAERNHLDSRFIKAIKRKDFEFISKIGIQTMSARAYYTTYVPVILQRDDMGIDDKLSIVSSALQNILEMSGVDNNEDFVQAMSDTKFVLNGCNLLLRPNELYDPNEAGILQLVDESMLPNNKLRQVTSLQTLRMLGMRSRLSLDGVLESAKQIELQAKNISFELGSLEAETISSIKNRSRALFNFLDNDDVIEKFLSESIVDEESQSHATVLDNEITPSENTCSDIQSLLSIAWLSVESPVNNSTTVLYPPRRHHGLNLVGISSPEITRPHSDAWICSYSRDILSCNMKSEQLSRLFGWDKSPPISVVARQLVALSKMGPHDDEAARRQKQSQASSQIYAILDAEWNESDTMERDETLNILKEEAWIWVGDKFVKTSQVAFEAPEHARPFLYSVPDQMLCYGNLLKHSGVRENFSGEDFVYLLSSLKAELGGNPCDSKQLDLAVFVARHLSRIPIIELSEIDKGEIFLPSIDGIMFRACEMTYDDAPWLSSIIKKSKHIFVHSDVGNEVARVLGSKSLRDVLSAVQNGMIKIPSPKSEALYQLLKKRSYDDINEHCKVIFELMEIAELRGTKQVTITFDMRNHGTMSLLHPCLASAQGPSLLVCFHNTTLEVDEVVRLTSPAKYYASIISGEGGAGGKGFSRFGRGFCGAFAMTDCLQVVLGRSLLIFDPTGNYLIEDNTVLDDEAVYQTSRQNSSNARNYGLSQSFCSQFPDQFDPFFTTIAGFRESFDHIEPSTSHPFFNGTILRIPFRSNISPKSCICSKLFDQKDIISLQTILAEKVSTCLLFSYHLQNVTIDVWDQDAMSSRNLSASQVNSSPITRRNHLEEMSDSKSWLKDKTRIGKLFKASWVPVRSSQFLEVSTRIPGTTKDVIDTYFIQSILAPPRLREMACTESIRPLNIIPVVSLAFHLNRSPLSESISSEYDIPVGSLFVGFDTGIKTGLPFSINAPLFLHEWTGNLLFDVEDDLDFKDAFPGIRNVLISDSNNLKVSRTLALHVWNNQAITSAMYELVPSTLSAITNCLEHSWSRNPKLFYKYWPFYDRIHPKIKRLIDANFFKELSNPKMQLYLTENDGFHTIDKGCFACPEHDLKESASFFLRHMALFIAPRLVVEDLSRHGINSQMLTPSVARSLLRNNLHVHHLSKQPSVALAVLEYCLADLVELPLFEPESSATFRMQNELRGLAILPMADGSIGKFGNNQIIATLQQQAMLPSIKNKFLSAGVIDILMPFVAKSGFLEISRLQKFGPKTLSEYISTVLPKAWEGCDFVKWDHVHPSKLWIYQFWLEVSISNQDEVQLFRRWPLIPTLNGDLASCANAPYIIYICPRATNEKAYLSLRKSFTELTSSIEDIDKYDRITREAEEQHHKPCASPMKLIEEEFWKLGMEENVIENDDSSAPSPMPSTEGPSDCSKYDAFNEAQVISDGSFDTSNDQAADSSDTDQAAIPVDSSLIRLELNYDPNTDVFRSMHDMLVKIQCPLLDASFINKEDARKLLLHDRLSVSRSIMTTMHQCMNYWSVPSGGSCTAQSLQWSTLSGKEYDQMLIFFSYHQNNRLSLMLSDLNLLKSLPLFETFAGTHISIQDRDSNFTIDASMDRSSLSSYIPLTLQSKLLCQKSEFKELYEDLNVSILDEASIIEKFILTEFQTMPLNQKEAVIKTILNQWEILRLSDSLISALRETSFVKCKQSEGEIIFVRPNQLLDPRNKIFGCIFNSNQSVFPAEEFSSEASLKMLEAVGLSSKVDKDVFLKCARIAEDEEDTQKAQVLLEYFSEHFGEFMDNVHFMQTLANIKICPAMMGKGMINLYRFKDVAAPKDENLTFKVLPVMLQSCVPPQVLFSTLGIISPPPISVVLRQLRALTENETILDRWTNNSSIDKVFSDLFSFLQDNFSDLSPRVKEALSQRAIVPVGGSFVKAQRLFFRLTKNLDPFFYEVPRVFGAYDVLLKNLGVRDAPRAGDYAVSLVELSQEIGSSKLNANELASVIEVVSLASAHREQSSHGESQDIFAPDHNGRLIHIKDLIQNDMPWLYGSGRIDKDSIHVAHPKLSFEICKKLQIKSMSTHLIEVLDEDVDINLCIESVKFDKINSMLQQKDFAGIIKNLGSKEVSVKDICNLRATECKSIRTSFYYLSGVDGQEGSKIDVTNRINYRSPMGYIHKDKILVGNLPPGITCEIAVSSALCDKFHIEHRHIAGISAMLGSEVSQITSIKMMLGVYEDSSNSELLRGEPGRPLTATDKEFIELKPLKLFKTGEIVAVRESNDSEKLVYGQVCDSIGTSLSRLLVMVKEGEQRNLLSSQVYSLRGGPRKNDCSQEYKSVTINSVFLSDQLKTEAHQRRQSDTYDLRDVEKKDILFALQDLLKSADMGLNDDLTAILDSNLTLKEQLAKKSKDFNLLEKRTKSLSTEVTKGFDAFLCPITREYMEDPVICCDGHTYERFAIETWLRSNSRSPKTNQPLASRELIPNHALRASIEAVTKLRAELKSFSNADD